MNRHLLVFTQRVASAAASSLVYYLADKAFYAKQRRRPRQRYTSTSTSSPYRRAGASSHQSRRMQPHRTNQMTKRPQSMAERSSNKL